MRDVLRQRYSVTWHPRLLYLIVSDGYMATVMRVLDRLSPAMLLKTLLKDVSKDLEKASCMLDKSQVTNLTLLKLGLCYVPSAFASNLFRTVLTLCLFSHPFLFQIHVRAWLESVSCMSVVGSLETLNPIVTCGPNTTDSAFSAATDGTNVPLFLQGKGTMGGTKELLEKVQVSHMLSDYSIQLMFKDNYRLLVCLFVFLSLYFVVNFVGIYFKTCTKLQRYCLCL